MGVGLDAKNSLIFSCSEDKSLKVTNLIDHKIIFGLHYLNSNYIFKKIAQ